MRVGGGDEDLTAPGYAVEGLLSVALLDIQDYQLALDGSSLVTALADGPSSPTAPSRLSGPLELEMTTWGRR
jgi:hypothetical protein